VTEAHQPIATRCGFVALMGAPNAGKSTLVNRLVGSKVSIVTPKVQTTRNRIIGIAMVDETQLVLIDTPGVFKPRRRLDRAMVDAAWRAARDADAVVVLIDARRGLCEDTQRIIDGLRTARGKAIAALNKIDLVHKAALLALADAANATGLFTDIFMISALTGDGVDDLRNFLAARAPEGPWMYPEDQAADMPMRLLAAEITREKVFMFLSQELPYATAVETEAWQERADGSVRIDQVIYVARPGHKGIVLGRGGQALKGVGRAARAAIGRFLGREAHLFLTVRVRENWQEEAERYRALGLDFEPRK